MVEIKDIEQKKNSCFNEIKKFCNLLNFQEKQLEDFVLLLLNRNQNFNFIGNSTISNLWNRHVLDCAQLMKYIENYDLKFGDFGSGAGFPGIILSILGLKEIHLIEKSFRKSEFLREAKLISNNKIFIQNYKLEELKNIEYDCIISRALAPLPKLLEYSSKFLTKEGFCLFLKGKNLQLELIESKKNFEFEYELYPSITSNESNIIRLKKISKKLN
jgi:16S rRNA (guanine527-N7)-methyltransferase